MIEAQFTPAQIATGTLAELALDYQLPGEVVAEHDAAAAWTLWCFFRESISGGTGPVPIGAYADASVEVEAAREILVLLPAQIAAGRTPFVPRASELHEWLPGMTLLQLRTGGIKASIESKVGVHWNNLRIGSNSVQGDLNLAVDLGASATVSFEASGSHHVILERAPEAGLERLRLRLTSAETNKRAFTVNVSAGVRSGSNDATAGGLLSAALGNHPRQLLDRLNAGVIHDWSAFLNEVTGIDGNAVAQAEAALNKFTSEWSRLPQLVQNRLWRWAGESADLEPARRVAALAARVDVDGVRKLFEESATASGLLEALAGQAAAPLFRDAGGIAKLAPMAENVLAVLDGSDTERTLRNLQTALMRRFAPAVLPESLRPAAEKFHAAAAAALAEKTRAALQLNIQQARGKQALFDVDFDFQADAQVAASSLNDALNGDLAPVLMADSPAVRIRIGALIHSLERRTHLEFHLPYWKKEIDAVTHTEASLTNVQHDGQRLLSVAMHAEDKAGNSALQICAAMLLRPQPGLRIHEPATMQCTYSLDTRLGGGREHIAEQLQGLLDLYIGHAIPAPPAAVKNANISVHIAAPATLGAGLWNAPGGKNDAVYMDLSRRLQSKLRRLLRVLGLAGCGSAEEAAPLLVWSALPVAAGVRLSDGELTLNTNRDVYWDWMDASLRDGMVRNGITERNLAGLSTLTAEQLCNRVRQGVGQQVFLALLSSEARLIVAVQHAGLRLAKLRAGAKPSETLDLLTGFGDEVARAFHRDLTSLYAPGLGRSLGPLLLLEAGRGLWQGTPPPASAVIEADYGEARELWTAP